MELSKFLTLGRLEVLEYLVSLNILSPTALRALEEAEVDGTNLMLFSESDLTTGLKLSLGAAKSLVALCNGM